MKRIRFVVAGSFLFLILASPAPAQDQIKRPGSARVEPPTISSISQSFYAMSINLVLNGTHFPSKVGGDIWRHIRLAPLGSSGDAFYAGQTGNWTPTRIDDLLGFSVQAGRRYKIGLVQANISNMAEQTLISNEVEFLLLMNLDNVAPNPVPQGATEVEVATANDLGPQGSMIVKLGNSQLEVIRWGGPAPLGGKFKVRIPGKIGRPATYDLWIEDNGVVVSKKIQVRLTGRTK